MFPEKDIWWYLDTRRFGTAPHSGFSWALKDCFFSLPGMANIRDVIPFQGRQIMLNFNSQ